MGTFLQAKRSSEVDRVLVKILQSICDEEDWQYSEVNLSKYFLGFIRVDSSILRLRIKMVVVINSMDAGRLRRWWCCRPTSLDLVDVLGIHHCGHQT